MPPTPRVSFRLREADLKLIEMIQEAHNLPTKTDAVRMAITILAANSKPAKKPKVKGI